MAKQADSPQGQDARDPLEAMFRQYVLTGFQRWCTLRNELPTFELLIEYLITQKVITPKAMIHYAIPQYLNTLILINEEKIKPSTAIARVATQYGLGISTLWSLWGEYKHKNKPFDVNS